MARSGETVSGDENALARVDTPAPEASAVASGDTRLSPFPWLRGTGPSAAIGLWKIAASIITLLAAFFYGVGSILADGFYSRLDASASMAGVDTIAIMEPIAIFFALFAISVTVVLMLYDVFRTAFDRMWKYLAVTAAFLAAVIVVGAVTGIAIYFKVFTLSDAVGVEIGTVWPVLQGVYRRFASRALGRKKIKAAPAVNAGVERESGEAAAAVKRGSGPRARLVAVTVSVAVIVASCVSAHYVGTHEAGRAEKGLPVYVHVVGIDVSSVSARRVLIHPVESNPELAALARRNCLLEIGSKSDDFLVYDARSHDTIDVPSEQVVVEDVASSRKCS